VRGLVLSSMLALCWAAPGLAQTDSSAVAAQSYWGPIPAGDAAPRMAYRSHGSHPIEKALSTPFYVATYPIYLFTRGLKAGLIFGDEHGFLPRLGPALPIRLGLLSAGPGFAYGGHTGFGGGGTLLLDRTRVGNDWVRLRYLTTVKGMHEGSGGLRAPWGAGEVEIGGGYKLERNARFFGLGPSSLKSDESFFTEEQSWAGVSYRRALAGRLTSDVKAVYSSIGTRGPRKEDGPGPVQQFASALPEGFGSRSDGVVASALLHYDTTKGSGRPEPGVIVEGEAAHFSPTGDYGDPFWRYAGEAGAFLPLWFTDRTLAVRGALEWVEAAETDQVPFTRLPTNHSGENLRGFSNYRWRDRGLLDVSAEYRWPVWALDRPHSTGVDAYLFLGSGQVFGEWHEITTHVWRTSWGGGFRAILSKGFGARIEIARSTESTQIRLRADQMFDFKGGLYAGNAHVATQN